MRGYQYSATSTFGLYVRMAQYKNSYVQGMSVTHDAAPRQHIWTFATAIEAQQRTDSNRFKVCPCTRPNLNYTGPERVPPFVGSDYLILCDTGTILFHRPGISYHDSTSVGQERVQGAHHLLPIQLPSLVLQGAPSADH